MKLKCPHCKSGRHKTQGDGCAKCLRCEKIYYFELTPAGKRYRYFSDEGKNNLIKLKDADSSEFEEEDQVPPGHCLYACKHPVTREYRLIIAKTSEEAMAILGWEETPGRVTWIMPIKVGKELKPNMVEPIINTPIQSAPSDYAPKIDVPKQKKEKPAPKKKREGPTLKQEILGQPIVDKEAFLEGTFLILSARMRADNKPVDEDHLKKGAKLYFSMYRKELVL